MNVCWLNYLKHIKLDGFSKNILNLFISSQHLHQVLSVILMDFMVPKCYVREVIVIFNRIPSFSGQHRENEMADVPPLELSTPPPEPVLSIIFFTPNRNLLKTTHPKKITTNAISLIEVLF